MNSHTQRTLSDFDSRSTEPHTAPLTCHINGVHLIGIVPGQPSATARLTGAITRYTPDVIGVPTTPQRVLDHHPEMFGTPWPSTEPLKVAAYAATQRSELYITSIDSPSDPSEIRENLLPPVDIENIIADITTSVYPDDLLNSDTTLTIERFERVDFEMLREWRRRVRNQHPDIYTALIADSDDHKAGCLHALTQVSSLDTIVAPLPIHSLPGVIDRLQDPSRIPGEYRFQPSLFSYTNPPQDEFDTDYT